MEPDIEIKKKKEKIHIYGFKKILGQIILYSVLFTCFFSCVAISNINNVEGNKLVNAINLPEAKVNVSSIKAQLKGRPAKYEIHGIDVARYQRNIDWSIIEKTEIEFVFIKATEGIGLKDSFFDRNWELARKTGIKRGAYHFFLAEKDAALQAANFLFTTSVQAGDLPPVLDVETTRNVSPAQMREGMRIWLGIVEKAYGLRPIIYTGHNFYKKYLHGHFDDYPLWIAHYNGSEKDPDCGKWLFWQHSDRGIVQGINKEVDLNVFRSTKAQLQQMCAPEMKTKEEVLAQLITKNLGS